MAKKCYYNIIDENWWTVDEDGLCWGIGKTPELSITQAEYWGLDCHDVKIVED